MTTTAYPEPHPSVCTPDAAEKAFIEKWRKIRGEVAINEGTPQESAAALTEVMRRDFLQIDDLNEPTLESFFAAHRVFSGGTDGSLGGFCIRFTVQYNLFSGTINALGSAAQVAWLKASHAKGELGCFLLTERAAGVLSGLLVEATATFAPEGPKGPGLLLETPTEASRKVWISQGLVAQHGVAIARLIVKGKDLGPHAFIVPMDAPGVEKKCMGEKTAFNSLDNAEVAFNRVHLPLSALLSKHASVDAEGKYVNAEGTEVPPLSFIAVAQRLLSGRLAIADNSVAYFAHCLAKTWRYAETRKVWTSDKKQETLASLPYIAEVFEEKAACSRVYLDFLRILEGRFAHAVNGAGQADGVSRQLQMLISMAKAEAVSFATDALSEVRGKVGSYSLMADSPYGATNDILYCMRFAEGDTHILQQSIARDVLRPYLKSTAAVLLLLLRVVVVGAAAGLGLLSAEGQLAWRADHATLSLIVFMMRNSGRLGKLGAWHAAGSRVYRLAHCASVLHTYRTVAANDAAKKSINVRPGDLRAFAAAALRSTAAHR